jgi:hypothetical protein
MGLDWKSVTTKLAQIGLPLLGTAFLGPAGPVAGGLAANLIASVLGKDPTKMKPEELISAVQNPEALVKLQEIEANHDVELRQIGLEYERLRFQDVANARDREVQITKATGKRDWTMFILAYLFVGGFFILFGIICWFIFDGKAEMGDVPQAFIMMLMGLFTTLTTGTIMILQYFYGSSKGSYDKNKYLAAAQPIAPPKALPYMPMDDLFDLSETQPEGGA